MYRLWTYFLTALLEGGSVSAKPLSLHPDCPHYFLWEGPPLALITSAEHYGALVNLDFDHRRYLDALAEDGTSCWQRDPNSHCASFSGRHRIEVSESSVKSEMGS